METSRKSISTLNLALLTLMALFTSCSDSEEPLQEFIERTDISITGEMELQNFEESFQSDATHDLVSYNFYGNPSTDFDYRIKLQNGYELIIRVHDEANNNPWLQVGQPYNIYPQNALADKLMYTTIELRTAANEPLYSSNLNETTPPAIYLDVFKVIVNDGTSLKARIRDMILYKYNNPDREIRINGTFVGAVTFE